MTKQQEEHPPAQRYPDSDDFPSGPDIGGRLPDITLADQKSMRNALGLNGAIF